MYMLYIYIFDNNGYPLGISAASNLFVRCQVAMSKGSSGHPTAQLKPPMQLNDSEEKGGRLARVSNSSELEDVVNPMNPLHNY